jgi:hypothetical protein
MELEIVGCISWDINGLTNEQYYVFDIWVCLKMVQPNFTGQLRKRETGDESSKFGAII